MKRVVKRTLVSAAILCAAVSAQADFNGPGPSIGATGVLNQLNDIFGTFYVNGRMADGSTCKVSIDARPSGFTASIEDKYSGASGLMNLSFSPKQRLGFFDIRTNPEVRVELRIRDRVRYPGAPTKEVDASVYIQEDAGRNKAIVIFEDFVRRKRYSCTGDKSAVFRPAGLLENKGYTPWTPYPSR